MTIHPIEKIKKLEAQLQERFENLVTKMQGRELNTVEAQTYGNPQSLRSVPSEHIRVATDDFATILKEIKAALGKR